MPRGYWRVVIAAVGGLSLAAAHPNQPAQGEQSQTQRTIAEALTNIASTNDERAKREEGSPDSNPCKRGDDQRSSDLCAQWKAADAAADSAWWAAFAGWFGGLSFLGVIVAVGLAFESNRIARDTAKRQLRAYVFPVRVAWEIRHFEDTFDLILQAVWKNMGQTPPRDLEIINIGIVSSEKLEELGCEAFPNAAIERYQLGPGGEVWSGIFKVSGEHLHAIWKGEKFLYMTGLARYRDTFQATPRVTRFTYQIVLLRDHTKPLEGDNFSWINWHITGPHNCADEECEGAQFRPNHRYTLGGCALR